MSSHVEQWRYWGRTGGTGRIVAVLRLPRALYDGRLEFEHFAAMEQLRPDGSWSREAVASGLAEKDWMHGWLDEADEIDPSTLAALLLEWQARDAPGPRRGAKT
jgi:hypothetical protein